MLDEIHYNRYNKRYSQDGIHEALAWDEVADAVESFKQENIFPEMIEGEKNFSMFEWLKVLPIHTFQQKHFEDKTHNQDTVLASLHRRVNGNKRKDENNGAAEESSEDQ